MAQHAINMMYGEVYGYAHYLQVNYYIPKKIDFFWYNVICKCWPWLKKNDPGTAQKMKPALSVMHAKVHAWSCQVLIVISICNDIVDSRAFGNCCANTILIQKALHPCT